MAFIRGKKVLLKFYKSGSYTNFLCATDCQITINTEVKQVATIGDGYWNKVRGAAKSYTVSLNGLIELTETSAVSFWLLENFDLQMLPVQFQMHFVDPVTNLVKIITGTALINSTGLTGVSQGFAGSSFEMVGDGAPIITNSATSCNATIGTLEVGPGDPDNGSSASVSYTGLTNAARLEYSVDGGAREVVFNPGTNGTFFLFGLSDGTHTIEVWAVCESGVDGESNEVSFEVTGGEAGTACAPPGVPAMSNITATSATATWAAASPVPGDGYYWEYGGQTLGTVLGSGFTSDLSTILSGLTEGAEYFFRVRSLCQEGVSESSFQTTTFTPQAPAVCNIPGAPVMSAITNTTATATWSAPSPAPADGYFWQVLNGISVIQSGSTSSLSVGLTDLPEDTALTFRVKAVCETGVSESGYNSTPFETTGDSQITWNFNEDLGNGSLVIRKNGVIVVDAAAAGAGMFSASADNVIQITLTATTGNITVTDTTVSIEIINANGSGSFNESFSVVAGHNYTINATVTS